MRGGLVLLAAAAAGAAEPPLRVLVFMSADTGPYREAVAGIREVLGTDVPAAVAVAPPHVPAAADIVVTLGSLAASWEYPARVRLVHAMSPGIPSERLRGIRVAMSPAPAALVEKLLALQPSCRRLGVPYRSAEAAAYAAELAGAGLARGLAVDVLDVGGDEDLPDVLRRLVGSVDALWVPPDPLLVNGVNLATLVQFARANRIPLYVPTAGLVALGGTAAVAPSFRELGRRSAQAASAPQGDGSAVAYPGVVETVVSRKEAAAAGLTLVGSGLGGVDRVLP